MSWDALKISDPEPEKEVTWGDYGKAAAGGAAGIGAGSAGLLRQYFEAGQDPAAAKIFQGLQLGARNLGEDIEGSMTEEGRSRLSAGVTTDKFWEHPVSSIALKATGMSPYLIAAAVPGALVGEGLAAMAATGGAAGWLAAGDVVDEITKKPDKMSDADLRKQSPLYEDFRTDGMEEKEAREKLNQIMVGAKPALAFILGAGTGVFGPAGNVVRGLGAGAAREAAEAVGKTGVSKGTNIFGQHGIKASAAEGAVTELAEEGYGGYAAQKGEITGGLRKDYDQAEILDRALTGMALGGVLGGATGIGAGRGKGKAKADEIREAEERRRGEEGVPAEVETGEAGVASAAEAAPPTRRQTAASKKGIEVVPAGHPSQAEADAITDMAQPVQPKVAPVVPTPVPPVPTTTAPPQQAPASPPVGAAAAPVTPEVTPSAAQPPTPVQPPTAAPGAAAAPQAMPPQPSVAAAAAPVHDEATLTEMAKRGFLPEEVAKLTPEQTKQILATAPAAPAAQATPAAATPDGSTQGVLPVASQPAQVATASGQTPAMPSAPAQGATAPAATPEAAVPAVPAVPAQEAAAKPKHKKGAKWEASTKQRAEHAKNVYDAHREAWGPLPEKRPAREAMALKIDAILANAAEHGLVPRESLPDDVRIEKKGQTPEQKHQRAMSIPERASGEEQSPHVIYLRELIGVRNALRGQKFGPKSEERARVADFLAEDAIGEKGLKLLAERRIEEGRRRKAVRGSGIAAPATKVTKGSEDRLAGEGRTLTAEEVAAVAAQYEKPGVGPKGAEILAKKAEPSTTEQVATAPKTVDQIPTTKPPTGTTPAGKGKVKAKEIKAKKEPKITEKSREEQKAPEPAPEPEQTTPEELPPKVIPPAEPAAKPADTRRIDMAMKQELKGRNWTELDIRQMSYERAEHILDEGINKGTEEAVAEEEIPEGMTAAQAKAFKKLTPEKQKAVRAALEARSSGETAEEAPGILPMADVAGRKPRAMQLASDEHDIWDTPIHKARDVFGHQSGSLSEAMSARDVLDNLNLEHLPDLPKYLQGFTRRRLIEIMGDVKIYIASPELTSDANGGIKAPGGYYHPGGGAHGSDYIVINSDSLKTQRRFAHVVIHEALHAALFNRINADTKLRHRIQTLMGHLKSELDADKSMQGTGNWANAKYALTNAHEFISEALSNPRLQEIMANIAVSPEMARKLHLDDRKPWTVWGAFVDKVRETLGFPKGTFNLLHETLKTIQPAFDVELSRAEARGVSVAEPQMLSMDALQDAAIGRLGDTKINVGSKLAAAKRAVSTAWDLSGRGEHSALFGPSNPLNRLFDLGSFMQRAKSAILDKYGGLKAANTLAKLERSHPEAMAKAKKILFDLSLYDINPEGDNTHLGKDKLMGMQAKNEIARLKREWNDPSLAPVRNGIRDTAKFFKDIHNAVSRETINNILAEANIHDKALAERIHTDGLTEEDEKAWAGTKLVSALNQVRALKQRQGWYVPFRRYGNYISAAEHELSVPANATKINDNTLQFVDPTGKGGNARARAQVKGYLRSNSHTPQGNKLTPAQIRKVWVDKNNPSQIVEDTDADAIPAYRVAMQTQHVEMHETEAEAQNSQADLRDAGLLNDRSHKREEAFRTDVTNIQSAMGTVLRSLEKQQRYIDADSSQKLAMREMFHDLTLGLSGTTSIKNSMRQRRNVAGESRDLGRVTADYAGMTANHLAMLQYRPKFDAVFKEMREYEHAHRSDKDAIRREEVRKEFQDRIYGKAAERAEQHKGGFVTRVLQLTRLSFLAGPSFHLINAHEVATTSLPVVGGRHGFGAALRAMTDAYSLIGSRGALMQGFKDTVKAYTDDSGFTDYVKLFKDTIGKSKIAGPDKIRRMQDMIDYMDRRNLYSNASIFEVAKYADPTGNIAGRTLDRADLMANQVGSAIEAINRSVTGLMAYNLEYKKNGGNHEAAMHYAYSTAHNTMGDYSAWNAAPVFNKNALTRMAFQFKKFPQKTYMLLGNIVGGIAKGDPQAMKQFAGLMVTHGMVAGALGMPTEPFKLALLAANAVGATGFTPEDYEYAVRKMMANLAGQKGGEILSKGLYRGIGIEVSGRMGYDSLLLRGQPKSQKDADLKTFLWDTMAGAPASYLMNQVQGAQAAFKGDFTTAIEKMSPLKSVGDITKAAVGLAGPKVGPSGKTTQEQFTPGEALARALGLQPASASELGALRGTVARQSKRLSADRSEVINEWVDASGAKKVDAQRAVQAFNAGRPTEQQITPKDLTDAVKRRAREGKLTKHGVTTSRRTKDITDTALGVFNP